MPLGALATRPNICFRPGTALRDWFEGVLEGSGIQVRAAFETNEIAAMVAYVSIGLGVTVLTRSLVAALDGRVAIIPISDGPPARLGLAWHASGYRSPAADRFLELARRMLVMPIGDGAPADHRD